MATNVTANEDGREQRLAAVADLYTRGWSQAKIGQELGVTQQQISYDLKIVRQRWLDSSIRDFDLARAQEIAKIDRIEVELWGAWERSNQEQPGDPRYMDGAMKCIHKRCELMGLDEPKKIALSDGDSTYGPFLTEDDRRNRLLAAFLEQGTASGSGSTVM